MKKFHKSILKVLILLTFLVAFPQYASGYETFKIPEQINIGIRYGESATPMVSLYAQGGLELGYYMGNEFYSVMSFLENEEILIRKDGFFMNWNETFIAYDFDREKDIHNTAVQGPIHIQIGETFNSREDAYTFITSLPKLDEEPYLVYEDGWKVWIGLYRDIFNAQEAKNTISTLAADLPLNIIEGNDKRIQVLSKSGNVLFMYNVNDEDHHFRAIPQKDSIGLIQVDGKKFRGNIIIDRYADSDLTIINQLDFEEYLYGVVPREMSGEWPIEAQKAQAVAARNFAVEKLRSHQQYGFDLCAGTHCQVYGGYSSEHPRSKTAVDETRGKLLTYNGKIVTAFYHSNSGGHTEDVENIWSSPVGYLKGVEDPYSIGAPNDSWTKKYTKQEIEDILVSKGLSVGMLENILVTEYSTNDRVLKLEFRGTDGKKVLEKEKVRSIFGYNNIKSTWFQIITDSGISAVNVLFDLGQPPKQMSITNKFIVTAEGMEELDEMDRPYIFNGKDYKEIGAYTEADSYLFSGKGWGHGVGMSQWGAKKMAEEGFTYDQILTYYYTGARVE
ncbi:SpoIID/LytB domain-containing protein [Clostridiaceae bacterium 35-E11]